MKYKKSLIFICLLIFLLGIVAVGASDMNETVIINENQQDELINSENPEINVLDVEEINNDDKNELKEKNDASHSLPEYDDYHVYVNDVSFKCGSTASIKMQISPAKGFAKYYLFNMYVIDLNNHIKIRQQYAGENYKTSETYSIGPNELEPGTYSIKIVNSFDKKIMNSAKLTVNSIPYDKYSVNVSDVSINYWSSDYIRMNINPYTSSGYNYRYDYYLKIYDSDDVEKISERYYGTSSKLKLYNLPANNLTPGMYTIKLINAHDKKVMDTAILTITSVPYDMYSVKVSDVSINYGFSGSIKMTITPSSSTVYKYKHDFYLKVFDSNNVEKISQRYYSTKSTKSVTYNIESEMLDLGEYTIKILNNGDNYVMSTAMLNVKSIPYSAYSVRVSNTTVNYGSRGSIKMNISSSYNGMYKYKYDFYLKVFDSNNVEKISQRYYSTTYDTSKTFSIESNAFNPGVYTIKIINNEDNGLMAFAKLKISKIILETQDIVNNCDRVLEYKIRASENNEYKSDIMGIISCNGNDYSFTTDSNGYATVNIHLTSGTYDITTKSGAAINKNTVKINSVYVVDKYKNIKINSPNAYYKQNKLITYSFEGNLNGYFKIYKGNSLQYSKKFNTNSYINDIFTYKKYSFKYSYKNLKGTGKYMAKIVDSNGKELAKSSFKIVKAPTRAYCDSYMTIGGYNEFILAYNLNIKGLISDIGGTAKFKINGKTYKVKVKNGVAKVKVKFSTKKKTYKCSVKFLGDKNYKSSKTKFKIKVTRIKNPIKVGKYKIKLTPKQYKSLTKSIRKCKSKTMTISTKYKYSVKKPYLKKVKKYKTTTCCKTLYHGVYLPKMNEMWSNGWTKVSEYTFTKKNTQRGIGLSAYTFAVTKWKKISYKKAYKTKYYPVKAKITTGGDWMKKPNIKIYAHGKTLKKGKVLFK